MSGNQTSGKEGGVQYVLTAVYIYIYIYIVTVTLHAVI